MYVSNLSSTIRQRFGKHSPNHAIKTDARTSRGLWQTLKVKHRPMRIEKVQQLINDSEPLGRNNGAKLIEYVVDLYAKYRIDGTAVEKDGDMLLFQWGTIDTAQGNLFEVDLTRQIMLDLEEPDDAADSMRQLSVTLLFEPNAGTKKIVEGNKWCYSPDSIDQYRTFIRSHAAYIWSANNKPHVVNIELGCV